MSKIKSINIHAGHNPSGKIGSGAVGILNESSENRKVTKRLIAILEKNDLKVHDCTCNNGTSQMNVLAHIVEKCNAHAVDLDVSIHFNSGRGDSHGDKKTGGVEVLVYTDGGIQKKAAHAITKKVSTDLKLTNRGVKVDRDLYFLHRSHNPAILVECCFVDDKDDAQHYTAEKMARAIAGAILSIR